MDVYIDFFLIKTQNKALTNNKVDFILKNFITDVCNFYSFCKITKLNVNFVKFLATEKI